MTKQELQDAALEVAKDELAGVLEEAWPGCWKAMSESYAQHDGEKGKFKYSVGLGLDIIPAGGDFALAAKCRYGVKYIKESEGRFVQQQEMGLE